MGELKAVELLLSAPKVLAQLLDELGIVRSIASSLLRLAKGRLPFSLESDDLLVGALDLLGKTSRGAVTSIVAETFEL